MELNSASSAGAAAMDAAATRFNLSVMLPLDEGKFDMRVSTEWMRVNWTRSFAYAAFYALFIFFGQRTMRHRPKVSSHTMRVSTEWMRVNWTRSFAYAAFYALFIFFGQRTMRHRPKVSSHTMRVSTEWMRVNWTRSFAYAAFYALFIFFGQRTMRHRPKFELRVPLVAWNLLLAVFSVMGCVRVYPEFYSALTDPLKGFSYSVCNNSYVAMKPTSYWAWLFTLSKVVELGDTVFIVLRKQQLIFLHWYHHITVLIYTWYSFQEHTAPGRWFMAMNYTVHALMYTYYALRALKLRMPRWVPMTITALQLAQMIVGTLIGFYTYAVKLQGVPCQQSWDNIHYQLLMYASYFILFAHFFYNVYFKQDGKFSAQASRVHSRVPSNAAVKGGGDGPNSTLMPEELARSLKKAE